ncbi:hypothetical protein BD309DRAFT_966099 [Dichomitus squalens]|uniref:Uncharacterized protein n=1 Tax=Dichomitus squalens TaxID=114155 RepID=A0A4Q9Q3G0_9APHY|nr:hypothetical protein BD309DRAFT_966099 [Dichomitus squalens]TBU61561.1 hypothetical protein BD310DRAFT_920251 [Dichomitus squalens]
MLFIRSSATSKWLYPSSGRYLEVWQMVVVLSMWVKSSCRHAHPPPQAYFVSPSRLSAPCLRLTTMTSQFGSVLRTYTVFT